MFWRIPGLSSASPVSAILDKKNFTLEELLDEDEIIQECKALNGRLINYLRGRGQVEQLIRYIIVEAPEDAEKKRTFKFPLIACEIFTCEVDILLDTLVEDNGLMDLLFSFLEPEKSHSTQLAGFFCKVVVCLLLCKKAPLMQYVQTHQDVVRKLVELIGITSIMEVLLRLVGADESMYSTHAEVQLIEDTNLLEMIMDKFSSSDSAEVHANAAETLCAIARSASPGVAAEVSSPSSIRRLFRYALEDSRPKSVVVNSLTLCISFLDPKRLTPKVLYPFARQMTHGSVVTANPEIVDVMVESLGDLLKLLDVSSTDGILLTTYGKLQPPLGRHRLKIVEFISVLLAAGNEAAEKKLIDLGALQRILDLFFEYPYNNFLHHHVENIIVKCLESKNVSLIEHVLVKCDLITKTVGVEKNFTLEAGAEKPTVPSGGTLPPRIGNLGHLTCISNKLIKLGKNNGTIQVYLQENSDWKEWYTSILHKRNAVANVYQWACGRPISFQDRTRDDDDYEDRDYDVATLVNNISQTFRDGIYSNDDSEEARGTVERDDEDIYFDDESVDNVVSSLQLGDDPESGSLLTNSNWFASENDRSVNKEGSANSSGSSSPETEGNNSTTESHENIDAGENEDFADTLTPSIEEGSKLVHGVADKPPLEWVQWRESSESNDPSVVLSNGGLEMGSQDGDTNAAQPSDSSPATLVDEDEASAQPTLTANTEDVNSSEPQLNSPLPMSSSQSAEGNSSPCTDNKVELAEQKEESPKANIGGDKINIDSRGS